MPVLADAYEKANGVKLVVSFGSSATLATQIQNGAPIDLFLAADYSFPEQLVAAGLADAKAPRPTPRERWSCGRAKTRRCSPSTATASPTRASSPSPSPTSSTPPTAAPPSPRSSG